MPEPVSCHAPVPGSSVIECDDISIGPLPPKPQQVEVHEGAAGARALVRSQTQPLVVRYERNPSEPIDTPYAELGQRCASNAIAGVVVIGGSTAAHPILGVLTALKTGIEIGQCIDATTNELQRQANERRAIENCVARGGTPTGIVDNLLTCEGAEPEQVR